jgi:6-phosphogluconolactonase
LTVHASPEEVAEAAAEIVLRAMRERRGRMLLASGPTTHLAYRRLGKRAVQADCKGAQIFFADERMVPGDHVESTYGAVKRTWLDPTRFPTERVHRIPGEIHADRAAHLAEEDLRTVTGGPPQLDLVLLDVGSDGHIAGLFPGGEELDETDRLFIPSRNGSRVTASLELLNHCSEIVIVACGAGRAEAIRSALFDPPGAVPASLVGTGERAPIWLIDRAAATLLNSEP